MTADHEGPLVPRRVAAETVALQLLYESFAFFMGALVDPNGRRLTVSPLHERWCDLLSTEKQLALLAPRDHGKSTTMRAHILWRFWRHGCDPATGLPAAHPRGVYSAVVFSATWDQAEEFADRLRELLVANAWLFGDIDPRAEIGARRPRTAWRRRQISLPSGASLAVRAFRTSTRGLHPDLLLLDDVLSDANSGTSRQRDLTWQYFAGTLLPMHAAQIIVVGTALHRDDLLHRLGDRAPGSTSLFEWRKYRAIDPDGATALWPERHSYADLCRLRDLDPTIFSREYQNDPRDDASSIFPSELTERALAAGAGLTFLSTYRKPVGEIVVMGVDLAVSEAARADYTVAIVVAFDVATRRRRVLTAVRRKGLDLAAQIELLAELCWRFDVYAAFVEDNGFQTWLLEGLRDRPETRGRVFGHTTGRDKTNLRDGVLRLRLALLADQWVMPSGDAESRRFARVWQDELSAYGWRDGRLEGSGEHDDTIMASWFVELAVRHVEWLLSHIEADEIVTMEDLGIEPVRIGREL